MMNANDPSSATHPEPEENGPDPKLPVPSEEKNASHQTVGMTIDFAANSEATAIVKSGVISNTGENLQRLGKYTIKREIGRGGMGVVYEAFDPDLRRNVALKVLGPHLANSPVARRRFQREARAAAAINHPHVLTIHSVEEDQQTLFLVMEYVTGQSLKEYLATRRKLDPIEAIRLSCQIADGLAAAHSQGVIHRDIKPANIMLDVGATRVRIADFGLARVVYENADQSSHDIVGTPAYMSPEQVQGTEIDSRSDLFGFGGVIYHMLSGHPPFLGKTPAETIHNILDLKPRLLHDLTEETPVVLSSIVEKLLQKDPKDRYQSAAEVGDVLRRMLVRLNQSASHEMMNVFIPPAKEKPHTVDTEKSTIQPRPQPRPQLGPQSRPKSAQKAFLVGGLLLAFMALSGGMFFWNRRGGDQTNPSNLTKTELSVDNLVPTEPVLTDGDHRLKSLTVGPDSAYKTIAAALKVAAPDCTISVVGPGPYVESLRIEDSALNGLTLRAVPRATLKSANAEEILKIENVSNVTLEGFDFDCSTGVSVGLRVMGVVDKFTMRDCSLTRATEKSTRQLVEIGCSSKKPEAEIRVEKCRFDAPSGAMCLSVDSVSLSFPSLVCDGCQFSGLYTLFFGTQSCRHLRLSSNVFLGGMNAINLDLKSWSSENRIEIVNNTFVESKYWLGFVNSFRGFPMPSGLTDSRACNNLILGGEQAQGGPDQFEKLLKVWQFESNWQERDPATNVIQEEADRLVTQHDSLDIIDRKDHNAKTYLVPRATSPLLTSGCGGDLPSYIGAKGPLVER